MLHLELFLFNCFYYTFTLLNEQNKDENILGSLGSFGTTQTESSDMLKREQFIMQVVSRLHITKYLNNT